MAQELREVFELLEQEAEVRVLVIVGTGGVFSRGREPLPPMCVSREAILLLSGCRNAGRLGRWGQYRCRS